MEARSLGIFSMYEAEFRIFRTTIVSKEQGSNYVGSTQRTLSERLMKLRNMLKEWVGGQKQAK